MRVYLLAKKQSLNASGLMPLSDVLSHSRARLVNFTFKFLIITPLLNSGICEPKSLIYKWNLDQLLIILIFVKEKS